jgi:hypothetical protein
LFFTLGVDQSLRDSGFPGLPMTSLTVNRQEWKSTALTVTNGNEIEATVHFSPCPHAILSQSSNINIPRQPNIPRTRAHTDPKPARRHNPLLPTSVPVAQIPPAQLECSRALCARRQLQLGKPTQLFRRGGRCRGRQRQVQLCNLGTGDAAAVSDLCRDCRDRVPQVGRPAGDGLAACCAGCGG